MKTIRRQSKLFIFLLDIIIIATSAVISNLLLAPGNAMFTSNNINIMINSIVLSILVYEIYLNIFRIYKHITRFESGRDYLIYILIIGAGYAGRDIIKSIKQTMREKYNIAGIIDDDKLKLHCTIHGIEVIGSRNDIVKICKKENID